MDDYSRPRRAISFLRPPRFSFSTSDFKAEKRFDAFLMTPITNTVGMAFECADPDKFVCEMEFQIFGRVSLVDIKRLNRVISRVSGEITKLGMISLQICQEGAITGSQGGPEIRAQAGDALMLHLNAPTTLGYSDAARLHGIYLHPSSLQPLLKNDIPTAPAVISASNPGLKLLSAWLNALSTAGVSNDDALKATIDAHIIDLVALTLGARDDAFEAVEQRTGKTARLQAILGHIAAHCLKALTAKDVAEAVGISERYLRQLLEETSLTFTEHLQEQRLLRAYVMLKDARQSQRKIAEIAADAGFSDPSYFNRIFRRRFDDTPSAVRSGRTTLK